MRKNKLEKRMYFLVCYNISAIQQGIQSLHACVEYSLKYGKDENYIEWAKTHKTVIILNGGTSNDGTQSVYGYPVHNGSMEQHFETLKANKIKCAAFREPDMNYATTAIAFLVDERVFNRKDYPNFKYTYEDHEKEAKAGKLNEVLDNYNDIKSIRYKQYIKDVGKDVAFLKEFLEPFRMA